jgi:phospholipid/cholesterol/gamma-HCH transport system permease protein
MTDRPVREDGVDDFQSTADDTSPITSGDAGGRHTRVSAWVDGAEDERAVETSSEARVAVLEPSRARPRLGRGWSSPAALSGPVLSLGGFFAMALDTLVLIPRRPFAWREFLQQCWFVARVSLLPTLWLAIPFDVLLIFTFNILLIEFGASDYSGAGAAYGTVTQIGPVVTVLVVAGAGATSMCADLGARTIREELDALRVMGINPIQALVVPRVRAATVVATLLSSVVMLVGLIGCFIFSVFIQDVTPGSFVGSLTVITHASDVVVSLIKAALFGLAAGLIACYKGITVDGGPAGVGNAVNETVVFTFVALFAINIVATAVGVKATL